GMSHGDGTALFNLFLEDGHTATPASQYIAKTHRNKTRLAAPSLHGLNNHISHPIRGSHDDSGVHCFVGRDHYETLCFESNCSLCNITSSKYIIRDSFFGIGFHERNVLMSCGMKYYVGTVSGKNLFNPLTITNVGDHRYHSDVRE